MNFPWENEPEIWAAYCSYRGKHTVACEREYKKYGRTKSKYNWFKNGYRLANSRNSVPDRSHGIQGLPSRA